MKKSELKQLIMEVIEDSLLLKRHDDKLVTVSDLEDRKAASNETFRNKEKLKAAGFKWDSNLNSWVIPKQRYGDVVDVISKINKTPTSKLITAIEDLPEFVQNSDNVSKKSELSTRIDGFINDLAKEANEAVTSEAVQKFLEFHRKFRKFSINNTILIYIQRPNATRVAGFRVWENKFFRRVKKGSKSITIFAPIFHKEDREEVTDTGFDQAVKRMDIRGFRAVSVFDVADTEPIDERGNIPDEPTWHDNNTPSELADRLTTYASKVSEELGINITTTGAHGKEKGYSAGDHINITSDVLGVAKAATLIHEIAHELMHWSTTSVFYVGDEEPEKKSTRASRELQAETVSYVVLRHYNLPVKHQATYIALWNKDKDAAVAVKDNLTLIRKVSNFIIDKIDSVAAEEEKKAPVVAPSGPEAVVAEEKEYYIDTLKRLLKKAYKQRDAEACVFYNDAIQTKSATVGFDTFKKSWAYEGWKRQHSDEIAKQEEEFKRFSYLRY